MNSSKKFRRSASFFYTDRRPIMNASRMDRRLSLILRKVSQDKIELTNETAPMTVEQVEGKLNWFNQLVHTLQSVYHKAHIQKLVPLLILIGYTFLGGVIIYYIEAPVEKRSMEAKQRFLDEQKTSLLNDLWHGKGQGFTITKEQAVMRLRQSVFWYTVTLLYLNKELTRVDMNTGEIMNKIDTLERYIDQMALRCWEIQKEPINMTETKRKVEESLMNFEQLTSVSSQLHYTWTFGNAVFLAITIYTTIGYGSVAPDTTPGKIATIIYAICGIPLYLLILHKFGRLFLAVLHKFYGGCLWTFYKCRCITEPKKYHETSKISFQSGTGTDESYNVPVSLAIGVTFGWMFTCAGVFCSFFETSWDYFTSFYFFFISLTTIGFGDVTPTRPEDMFAIFGFIVIGLSLVSMCINVVQLKLELLFEEMMITLMEEYRNAQLQESQLVEPGGDKPSAFSTLFKVWKKRHASGVGSDLYVPLMARKQQQVLFDEWKKKAQMRVVGTQTEADQFCNISTQTDFTGDTKEVEPNANYIARTDFVISEKPLSLYAQKDAGSGGPRLPLAFGHRRMQSSSTSSSKQLTHSPSLPLPQKIPCSVVTSVSAEIHASNEPSSWSVAEGKSEAPYDAGDPSMLSVFQPKVSYGWPYSSAVSSEVPAMFTHKQSKQTANSDFKDLLHEIGARITECRNIVTPSSTPQLIQKPRKLWDDK